MPSLPAFREPGAVLLLSCYELGHQPLGTALPAAWLERAGFAPVQLDLAREPFDAAKVRRARFVGISAPMHTALRLGVAAARRIRRLNPTAFVCCYGLYAWLNAEYLLEGVADAVIGGESERALVELVERLAEGRKGDAPGGGVWRRGRPASPVLERLEFAAPSRDTLPPLEAYAHLVREGREVPAGYVEASRGCLHYCLHCPIPPVYGGRFFVVPREIVLEDIRKLVHAGAGHITFGDPDFLNGPGHSLRIARALHAEFPPVTFDFTAKVEHLLKHQGLLPELASLGCVFVVSAVESLSDRVLACLEKGHTRADALEVVRVVREAGIALRPSLLPFTPWSTLDEYLDLLDWVEQEGLGDCVDPVQLSIRLLVPPGSALLGKPWVEPYLEGLDPESFTFRWAHPDPRMDELHQAVSALVAAAAEAGEDAAVTLGRIRQAARAAAGRGPAEPALEFRLARTRSPRLTEPWFC